MPQGCLCRELSISQILSSAKVSKLGFLTVNGHNAWRQLPLTLPETLNKQPVQGVSRGGATCVLSGDSPAVDLAILTSDNLELLRLELQYK